MKRSPIPIKSGPIGVFDSGIGGLTVVKEIMGKKVLTKKNLLSENEQVLPLGDKNPEYRFYVTDAPERVSKVASRFFAASSLDNLSVSPALMKKTMSPDLISGFSFSKVSLTDPI